MTLYKPKFWNRKYSVFAIVLLPFSYILQLFLYFKKTLITKYFFNIPLICVGNIYVGGTGKTPTSIEIFKILKKLKKNPVILKKKYLNHFDEEILIKKKTGNLITNKSRKSGVKYAEKLGFKSVVLDDGFQDFSINKDLEILCFHGNQLLGNGFTLPSGPLRENLNSIRRAKIIIINGKKNKNFESKIRKISSQISIYYSNYMPMNIKQFKKDNFYAFAGIGNPENFFEILIKNRIKVKKKKYFPDHHIYSKADIVKMIDAAKKENLRLLTTEKDFLRIKKLGLKNFKYLSVKLNIEKKNQLIKEIKKYI